MTFKKIDLTANFLAFIYSLLLISLLAAPLVFGFSGIGRMFMSFAVVGWILIVSCCASFFLLANKKKNTGVFWLVSGVSLNCTLSYVFLLLWKFSYIFFYTSLGQMVDIRLSKMLLPRAIVLYSVSYLMICFGLYEIVKNNKEM